MNDNKEKLLVSARKEFLEKGFEKASLRKICTDAGLTTGAVYFFFQDKNGLFGAVVEEAVSKIQEIILRHFESEAQESFAEYQHTENDHDAFTEELISALYYYYDTVLILLTKAQGSEYENFVDSVINMVDQQYQKVAAIYASAYPDKKINEYVLHWFAHLHINAFTHLITHEPEEQKALQLIRPIMNYLIQGWTDLILTDKSV